MPTEPHSFTFQIGLARSLLAQVTGRDGLDMRPVEVRPAVIGRLAAGVRVLASFVRRLLVLMALSMEHGLVDRIDRAKPLARPHGRGSACAVRFVLLEPRLARVSAADRAVVCWFDLASQPSQARRVAPPSPARLYRLLDVLATIVANPEPRALRLAFHLARRRDGPILPPAGPARIAGCWGTQVCASHDAMAEAILSSSRVRPPPLPPPRRAGPTLTSL
jgi:hypothetical protein